jgi:hypothetical protein
MAKKSDCQHEVGQACLQCALKIGIDAHLYTLKWQHLIACT